MEKGWLQGQLKTIEEHFEGEPTRDELRELEMLAARMSRDSRWQVTLAAFKLGLKLGRKR